MDRKFQRDSAGKCIAGICSGLEVKTNINRWVYRTLLMISFVLPLSVITLPSYLLAWVLLPTVGVPKKKNKSTNKMKAAFRDSLRNMLMDERVYEYSLTGNDDQSNPAQKSETLSCYQVRKDELAEHLGPKNKLKNDVVAKIENEELERFFHEEFKKGDFPVAEKRIKHAVSLLGRSPINLPNELTKIISYEEKCYFIRTAPISELAFREPLDITLQKTEICYFASSEFSWYEEKKIKTDTYYTGSRTSSSRSYKTFTGARKTRTSYSGSLKAVSTYKDEWQPILCGNMYLTNKRIIFKGKETKNIQLKKILSMTVMENGLVVYKDTGKPAFFKFSQKGFEYYKLYLLIKRLQEEFVI